MFFCWQDATNVANVVADMNLLICFLSSDLRVMYTMGLMKELVRNADLK